MTSVLITGANGFIGRHLITKLRQLEQYTIHTVSSGEADISQPMTWSDIPSVDVLIHLASKSSVPLSWEYPYHFIEKNCLGTALALEYCRKNSSRLIFLSSYMYGDAGSEPINESASIEAKNPYALTKYTSEVLCDFYCKNFGIDSRILRPFNVYGPMQSSSFLIPQLVREAVSTRRVSVNDLHPRRDFLYVDDLVSAIVKLINYRGNYTVFNVGTGQSYSVEEVVNALQAVLGYTIDISCKGIRRKGEIMDSVASIQLAQIELSWNPGYSLAQGLRKMLSVEGLI